MYICIYIYMHGFAYQLDGDSGVDQGVVDPHLRFHRTSIRTVEYDPVIKCQPASIQLTVMPYVV